MRTEEIKASLLQFEAGLTVIEELLPRLMVAYQLAEVNDLCLPAINSKQFELLAVIIERLGREIDHLQVYFSEEVVGPQEENH